MRIGGERVTRERVLQVRNPWNGELIGTVPKATVADVRAALEQAVEYRPTLTRHERATILRGAARILEARRDTIADLITAESGLCLRDTVYEVGRAVDVLDLA